MKSFSILSDGFVIDTRNSDSRMQLSVTEFLRRLCDAVERETGEQFENRITKREHCDDVVMELHTKL